MSNPDTPGGGGKHSTGRGGVALIRCIKALDKIKVKGEQKNGIAILKHALAEPLQQIAGNASHKGSVVA